MPRSTPRPILVLEHADLPEPDAAQVHFAARGATPHVVHPWKGEPIPDLAPYGGLMVLGGAQMVTDLPSQPWMAAEMAVMRAAQAAGMPMLCICLGAQMLAHAMGAEVGPDPQGRIAYGFERLTALPVAPGTAPNPIPDRLRVLCGNAQGFAMPEGAERLATAGGAWPNLAFRAGSALALQFHPEVTRAIFDIWQRDWIGAHDLPGAQPKARQDADFPRDDPALKTWLRDIIDLWFHLAPEPPLSTGRGSDSN